MPPPLSDEPPIKISTADIGKIIGEKEGKLSDDHEQEGEKPSPDPPAPPAQEEEVRGGFRSYQPD